MQPLASCWRLFANIHRMGPMLSRTGAFMLVMSGIAVTMDKESTAWGEQPDRAPNIVLILADDK